MRKKMGLCGAVLALGWAGVAQADEAGGATLAEKFGAREGIEAMSLSPDGSHVAMIVPMVRGQRVLIADLVAGGAPKGIFAVDGYN